MAYLYAYNFSTGQNLDQITFFTKIALILENGNIHVNKNLIQPQKTKTMHIILYLLDFHIYQAVFQTTSN